MRELGSTRSHHEFSPCTFAIADPPTPSFLHLYHTGLGGISIIPTLSTRHPIRTMLRLPSIAARGTTQSKRLTLGRRPFPGQRDCRRPHQPYAYWRAHHANESALLLQRSLCTAGLKSVNELLHPTLHRQGIIKSPTKPQVVMAQSVVAFQTPTTTLEQLSMLWQRLIQSARHMLKTLADMLALSWRTAQVVGRLSPLLVMTPAAVAVHPWVEHNRLSDLAWNYLTGQMQALGPVFVKLCQWVATRPDIFPPHFCERLSCLHDKGLPHAWKHTHQMLTDAFGDYQAAGLTIQDPAADVIGCGSAAQVYRGTLTTGEKTRPVAIKVLHPRFHEMVERDFWLLHTLAEWLHAIPFDIIRMINLPRVASNFGSLLQAQSDLRVEADHLSRFRRNFYGVLDDDNNSSITFPRPMKGWVSSHVLVEDLIEDATPISVFLRDSSEEGIAVRSALAGPLLRAFLKMIFIDNFTHGDLHPGNVFIRTQQVPVRPSRLSQWLSWTSGKTAANDSASEEQPTRTKRTIVFLDAGIATSLSPSDQRNLIDLFRAVILNKGKEAGRLMVERAKYERCSQTPGGVEAFSEGIGKLVAEFHDNRKAGLTLGAVRIGSLLSRVLDLCRIHGVEIDPAMASIVVSTLVLEGLGRSLDSTLNLIDFAMPFVLGRGKV